MTSGGFVAVVQAWQSGALSRESMLNLFRRGEILPEGRTNEEETALLKSEVGRPKPEVRSQKVQVGSVKPENGVSSGGESGKASGF